jgi:hypothetical protein
MSSRYLQVIRTYWQRWLFWVLLVPTLLIVLPLVVWPPQEQAFAQSMVVPIAAIGAWWVASIVAHVKEQIADPRSVLLPRFRTPHVVVAVVSIALIIFVLPAAMGRWMELSAVGVIGIVALCAVLTGWLAYLQSVPATGIWIGLCLLILSKTVRLELVDALSGASPRSGWILLAMANGLLIALILRMILLHDEMPEYVRQPIAVWSLKPTMTGDRTLRLAAAETHWLNAALAHRAYKLNRLGNIYDAGLWRRAKRWRLVTGPGWAPWLVALALALWATFMPLLEGSRGRLMLPEGVAGLMPFLPLPFVAFGWLRRWHSLGYELTRPGTRNEFFAEMGLAMFLDLAEAFVALVLCSMIPLAVWRPMGILDLLSIPFYPVVALANLLMFGVVLWVLRFRIGWLSVITILWGTLCTGAITGLFFWTVSVLGGNGPREVAVGMWLLIGLLILSIFLICHAYKLWCQTDLD